MFATFAVAFSVCATLARAALSPAWGRLATTSRGRLEPGPKPLAMRSYACLVVSLGGLLPASLLAQS